MVGAKGEYTSLESGISGASRTFVTNRNRSTHRTMRSRILYLLRFALVVLLSFLVLKGCFLLLVPADKVPYI